MQEPQEIKQKNVPQAENVQQPQEDILQDAPAFPQVEQEAEPIQQTPRRSDRSKKKSEYLGAYI